MPQTLLALCGLVVATFLTLQAQRHRAMSSEDIVQVELAQMGSQIATDMLNEFRSVPFDEATVENPATSPVQLHNHLQLREKASDRFQQLDARREVAKVGLTPSTTIATLDHADGRSFLVERASAEGTVPFRVSLVVGYVEADGQTMSPAPTKLKMATVRVVPQLSGGMRTQPIYISQLYACGSGCDW